MSVAFALLIYHPWSYLSILFILMLSRVPRVLHSGKKVEFSVFTSHFVGFFFAKKNPTNTVYSLNNIHFLLLTASCSPLSVCCLLSPICYSFLVVWFFLPTACFVVACCSLLIIFCMLRIICDSWSWQSFRIWVFTLCQTLITIRSTLIVVQLLVASYSLLATLFSFLSNPYRSLRAPRG